MELSETPHRKKVIHYNTPCHAHLLTFSCYQRLPLMTNNTWREWFSKAIDNATSTHYFNLIAFVYMPEHMHLLVFPTCEDYSISKLLFAIKRPFSFHVKEALQKQKSPLLNKLTIRDRPGHMSFRFWQEGSGHDRNLISVENTVKAAEYIHNNPVRRRLSKTPDAWRWSSWKHYHRNQEYDADPAMPRVNGFPG